jgi:two-component system sensor histidine kinase KdpD
MNVRRSLLWAGGYPLAIIAVALFTALCVPFREDLPAPTFMLIYVPLIVGMARVGGTRPSAFASVLSVACVDFFLVEPYHTLSVSRPTEWIALAVFLAIALIAGQQTGQLRDRERAALRGEQELSLLNKVAFRMVSDKSVDSTLAFLVSQVADALQSERTALYLSDIEGTLSVVAASGKDASTNEAEFARWIAQNGKAIGLQPGMPTAAEPRPVTVSASEALAGELSDGVYLPLQTTRGLEGVLYSRLDGPGPASAENTSFLVAVANLASAALDRQRLERTATQLAAEREADRLKSTLVSSVSHELRTPLAAAIARVTGLLGETGDYDPQRLREEMSAIAEELTRLNAAIGDLLDLSRLESDSWRPVTDVYEMSEILGSVASKLTSMQSARVHFSIPRSVPFIEADFSQLVRALENVIENALAYSPADEPVEVRVSSDAEHVTVAVEDRGPGVPDAEKTHIFEKFYRGTTSVAVPSGTGLGLAIAREIVNGHGGRLWVEDSAPRGARFIVELPVAVIGAESE